MCSLEDFPLSFSRSASPSGNIHPPLLLKAENAASDFVSSEIIFVVCVVKHERLDSSYKVPLALFFGERGRMTTRPAYSCSFSATP